tara:strand:- start:27 stop:1190 length:1164 start_codon:yes stop_codon:yes gene_type:complete
VPSGWTTSGIDWTNIRDNRYEQTVLELYKATHERDFFIRKTAGRQNSTQYNTPSPRIRLDSQLKFIMDTLTSWLTTELTPTIADGLMENQAVFIDESQIPTGLDLSNSTDYDLTVRRNNLNNSNTAIDLSSSQINMQIPHYDIAVNGNLETALSLDLSFLRSYQTGVSERATSPDNLKSIYDILRFLTKSRAYQIKKTGLVYQHYMVNNIFGGQNTATTRKYLSGSFNSSTATAYNVWASDLPTTDTGGQYVYTGYSQETDYRTGGTRYRLDSNESFFKMITMTGHDGNSYDADDFEFQMLYNQFTGGWPNNPMIPIVDGINAMGDIHETSDGVTGIKPFIYPNTQLQTFPPILTNFDRSIWETLGKLMPYANLNKEGFLNYYTETP